MWAQKRNVNVSKLDTLMRIDSKDNHHLKQPSRRFCGSLGFMNTQMGVYSDSAFIRYNDFRVNVQTELEQNTFWKTEADTCGVAARTAYPLSPRGTRDDVNNLK